MRKSRQFAIEHDSKSVFQASSGRSQLEKFQEMARELGADESEEAFDKRLRQIAESPPPQGGPEGKKPKTKKPGQ